MWFAQTDVIDKVFSYGLPTVLLVGLCIGLWKIIVWAKHVVVEPMVTSHVELMGELKKHAARQSAAMDEQTDQLKAQTESLMEIKMSVKEAIAKTEAHTEWSQQAVKNICKAKERKEGEP